MTTVMPYGRWASPLAPRSVAAGRCSRSALLSDGESLYWAESRPEDGGRLVVVRAREGAPPADVTPPGSSVRSRVHEYGGGAYCLLPGRSSAVAYVEHADQAVRLLEPGAALADLSPAPPRGERWAHGDLRATPDGRWVLCVRERHLEEPAPATADRRTVLRELVAYPVCPAPGGGVVLWSGPDFVASPRPDVTGGRLAWTCWNHPDMPWDASEVWVGDLVGSETPAITGARRVDGGRQGDAEAVAVGQPLWDSAGALVYVSDRGGWWRPWRWEPGTGCRRLTDDEAEYHGPDWVLGQATMALLPDGGIVCRRRREGSDRLVVVDPGSGAVRPVDQPCVSITAVCAHREGVGWLGSTVYEGAAAWWSSPHAISGTAPAAPIVRAQPMLEASDVSVPEPFTFANREGRRVHCLYYSPHLSGLGGPPGERPPLLVHCHGGPTGAAEPGFDPLVQIFTTSGFAVAAVDYAGSTGHGRPYRQALAGRWGVSDVDDCVDAALALAAAGRADRHRMAIHGSSAGGFTALSALVRSDAFAAAVSWYGVTDLEALAASTHDFEAHYTDGLVGALPEAADEYRRRSPVHRTAEMTGAVLLLQGLDDPVVPPSQAIVMAEALRARGRRCELLTFAGESHGFRRAGTVEQCLEAEMAFYRDQLCRP